MNKCKVCRKKFDGRKKKYCNNACSIRAANLRRRYNVTSDYIVKLYKDQAGSCAICDISVDIHELGFCIETKAHIDHLHGTEVIRGLLCGECNMGLGKFKDNRNSLKKAIKYLGNTFKRK